MRVVSSLVIRAFMHVDVVQGDAWEEVPVSSIVFVGRCGWLLLVLCDAFIVVR